MKYQVVIRDYRRNIAKVCGHAHRTSQAAYACKRKTGQYCAVSCKWFREEWEFSQVENSNGDSVEEFESPSSLTKEVALTP